MRRHHRLIERHTDDPFQETATAQLRETFSASGGAELVRDAVRLVFQQLIEAEVAEAIGAGRYERSDMRVTERNGHRSRLLATQAGDLELKIPKLRRGSFLPSVIEPRSPRNLKSSTNGCAKDWAEGGHPKSRQLLSHMVCWQWSGALAW